MSGSRHSKIKLREVNRHLVCRLCRGYYVDATTIAECLHSFCRSCIIKYLEKNSFCPICEVQIHKTKPYLSLRLDKALQDVVYKVVPGLYHDEMKRRRIFYAKRQEQIPFATPEQCGVEERIIFSPEDSISLSLEYLESDNFESDTVSSQSSESGGDNPDALSFPQQLGLIKLKNNEGKNSRRESQDVQESSSFPKRYLQCPAVVNVGHLKKFIRMKHELKDKMQISIIHKRVPLPDHYTLMDVAYIFTWKRSAPLRFFYQIYQTRKQKLKILPLIPEAENAKPEIASEEAKPVKTTSNEELTNGVKENSPVKESEEKSDTAVSEVKEPEVGELVIDETSKVVPEVTKSEPSVKSDIKEVISVEVDPNAILQNGKSEKTNISENKNKVGPNKRKSAKTTKELNEGETMKERLLLNPISGKLESVSSADASKPTEVSVEKASKDTNEKTEIAKEPVKTDTPNPKDSKKSHVNLLKTFRKEKGSAVKDSKVEFKNSRGNSLTITAVSKNEKPPEKETATFSVEIKAESKESEYDFDGSSPPSKIIPLQEFSKYSKYSKYMADHRDKWLSKESKNSWMSLQDFREKILKENNITEDDSFKKNKKKVVPSLYKINSEGSKMSVKKTPNGKPVSDKVKGSKVPRTVINIQTETDDKKSDIKVEVVQNKGVADEKSSNKTESEPNKPGETQKGEENKSNGFTKDPSKKNIREKVENENCKSNNSPSAESVGAIDLSKGETSPKSGNRPETVPNKPETGKCDEKIMEALITAAQKQSIEPLLKIPQYSQMLKDPHSPVKNISPNDISQALQFLEDLRSDIKVLESKNQLNPSTVLEQFAQKSANFEPYQQLYQQKIDLIRRLKRHQQILPNESDAPQKKLMKLSPTSESKKKLSPESKGKSEELKASIDKTLSQIQLMELQSRMLAAHNYKNLPALLQYYNRPPGYCSGPTSPNKPNQSKSKSSSHSPKSPQGLVPPANSDSSFFSPQSYGHLINAGLNSEMTYHQMFQSYLNQQEQMNQIKLSQIPKKPVKFSEVSAKSISDKYYAPPGTAIKQEPSNSSSPKT